MGISNPSAGNQCDGDPPRADKGVVGLGELFDFAGGNTRTRTPREDGM
jgi:hypothetical protein